MFYFSSIYLNYYIKKSVIFFFITLEFDAEINADEILQTEEEYTNATGDDIVGFFDISII